MGCFPTDYIRFRQSSNPHDVDNIFFIVFILNYVVYMYRHTPSLFFHFTTSTLTHKTITIWLSTYTHLDTNCVILFYQPFQPGYQNKACLSAFSTLVNLPRETVCVFSQSVCFGLETGRPSSPWQTIPGILYKLFICTSARSLSLCSSLHPLPPSRKRT